MAEARTEVLSTKDVAVRWNRCSESIVKHTGEASARAHAVGEALRRLSDKVVCSLRSLENVCSNTCSALINNRARGCSQQ